MKNLIIAAALTIGVFLTGIYVGTETTKNQYLNRAAHLAEKDFFTNRDIEHILFNEPLPMLKDYILELKNEGWTEEAAEHIAKVEMGFLPCDEEYISYMED